MSDPALADEALAIVRSARLLLEELVEEGVMDFERIAVAAEAPVAPAAPPSPTAPTAPERPPIKASVAAPSMASSPDPAKASATPTVVTEAGPPELAGVTDLEGVRAALGECTRCGLCEKRQRIVFGDGAPDADILFIGEGPGQSEDEQGLPFVGRAGELLTQMIEKGMGIPRASVYICNIVKCRPPGNRNPLPPEVSACRPFLDAQIAAVKPKVIVTLGKPAASLLLGRDVSITRERGIWQAYRGTPLMPTLHPAYVLRQYTPDNRRAVWEDLTAALERSREG